MERKIEGYQKVQDGEFRVVRREWNKQVYNLPN